MPLCLTEHPGGGVRFSLKVVPGASRDRVVGLLGDALKVAVSKPPADGAANKAVVKLLAASLGVAEAQVAIVRGHSNPRKEVVVAGISADQVTQRLSTFL
jgi:uncharacterized protein (TIGR00251 family)